MANIPLQSIKFPDLPNIYDAPTMEGIGKGIFPELIAGGLVDLDSYVENSNPYLFAAMPQGAGKVLTDELVGAKVAWNQLAKYNARTGTVGGISFTIANDGTVTLSAGTTTGVIGLNADASYTGKLNHILFISGCPSGGEDGKYYFRDGYQSGSTSLDIGNGKIIKKTQSDNLIGQIYIANGITIPTLTFKPQIIDLTQMLGSTIADHIYSLEQGTAGAGVAFFTKYFGNGYRPFDSGSLQGALVSGHKMTGVNQWDEEIELGRISTHDGSNVTATDRLRSKNYIPIVPNTSYFFTAESIATQAAANVYGYFYDADKNYIIDAYINHVAFNTPSNARYMRFMLGGIYGTTFKNDVCVNISNADINGKYFPYEEHTYDIEPEDLNGMFKLVDGELKADGDVRHADGAKDVNWAKVDLGSLTWIYESNGDAATANRPYFYSNALPDRKQGTDIVCGVYATASGGRDTLAEKSISAFNTSNNTAVCIMDSAYTSASALKSSLSGKYMEYKLATPTEDTAEPFEEYQACKPYGTEQYILYDSQIVPIPAGHNTKYFEDPLANIMARLDALENA